MISSGDDVTCFRMPGGLYHQLLQQPDILQPKACLLKIETTTNWVILRQYTFRDVTAPCTCWCFWRSSSQHWSIVFAAAVVACFAALVLPKHDAPRPEARFGRAPSTAFVTFGPGRAGPNVTIAVLGAITSTVPPYVSAVAPVLL